MNAMVKHAYPNLRVRTLEINCLYRSLWTLTAAVNIMRGVRTALPTIKEVLSLDTNEQIGWQEDLGWTKFD
jgi:hypothetical protein